MSAAKPEESLIDIEFAEKRRRLFFGRCDGFSSTFHRLFIAFSPVVAMAFSSTLLRNI